MKIKKEDRIMKSIGFWFGVIIFSATFCFMVYFMYMGWSAPTLEGNRLCASKFNDVEFSFVNGFKTELKNFHYQYVSDEYFNCCWDEYSYPFDNTYYTEKITKRCIGFKR